MRRAAAAAALAAAVALGGAVGRADVTPPPSGAKVAPVPALPRVLVDEWKKADNRASCAPVWFDALGEAAGATVRRRMFAGGWGVSLVRGGRVVAGVAGAGVVADDHDVTRWKLRRTLPGGARAGYGLEGDTIGPDWLAYVVVPGQRCLYNVWSYAGRAHLEFLLDHLRVVPVAR